jgi:Ser/Thr protein kinase RdoA (MazF antagonist)
MLKEPLKNRQEDYKFLQTSSQSLWKFIKDRLVEEPPNYGYCHGDMHSGNVFFDGEQPKIFDFDCMGYGYRAYDICIIVWNETFSKDDYIETDEWKKYIEGYSSVRKLLANELSCIPAFAALRHLWHMGLHLDTTDINNNWSWLNDNYFNQQISKYKLWYNRVFPSANVGYVI